MGYDLREYMTEYMEGLGWGIICKLAEKDEEKGEVDELEYSESRNGSET